MMTKLTAPVWHLLGSVMVVLYHCSVIVIMTMVALFHAVPLTIELIWSVWKKYVVAAVEHYRIQRSIRTMDDPTDGALGVESAMPHIFKQNTKTPSGENDTVKKQKPDGND
jgi:hypothetical protein